MKNILIIAGESSGDSLGAGFVKEFRARQSEVSFFGLGGYKMKAEQVELLYHIDKMSFLGFWEVLKNYSFIKRVEKKILQEVDQRKPSMAVLIDYPGFNLRLAKKLKKRGIKIFYYISPQIWAWGKGRIRKIKRYVDLMTVIFKFEERLYKDAGVPVEWVGYPMLEQIKASTSPEKFRKKLKFGGDSKIIGLFPGSRLQEVRSLLPEMLEAVRVLKITNLGTEAVIARAPAIDLYVYQDCMAQAGVVVPVVDDMAYDIMKHATINLVCSGTATLECAILETPLIVLYKTSFATYHIARNLINIDNIGMVNIVAGRQVVPELIQHNCTAETIAEYVIQYFNNPEYHKMVKQQLAEIKNKLGDPGAAGRAAELGIKMLAD